MEETSTLNHFERLINNEIVFAHFVQDIDFLEEKISKVLTNRIEEVSFKELNTLFNNLLSFIQKYSTQNSIFEKIFKLNEIVKLLEQISSSFINSTQKLISFLGQENLTVSTSNCKLSLKSLEEKELNTHEDQSNGERKIELKKDILNFFNECDINILKPIKKIGDIEDLNTNLRNLIEEFSVICNKSIDGKIGSMTKIDENSLEPSLSLNKDWSKTSDERKSSNENTPNRLESGSQDLNFNEEISFKDKIFTLRQACIPLEGELGEWASLETVSSISCSLISHYQDQHWNISVFDHDSMKIIQNLPLRSSDIDYKGKIGPRIFAFEDKAKSTIRVIFYLWKSKWACELEILPNTKLLSSNFRVFNLNFEANNLMNVSFKHNILIFYHLNEITTVDIDSLNVKSNFGKLHDCHDVLCGEFFDEDKLIFANSRRLYCFDFKENLLSAVKSKTNFYQYQFAISINKEKNIVFTGGFEGTLFAFSLNFSKKSFAHFLYEIQLPSHDYIDKMISIDSKTLLVWQCGEKNLSFIDIKTHAVDKMEIEGLNQDGIVDICFQEGFSSMIINDSKNRVLFFK